MIKAKDIHDMNHVKEILDNIGDYITACKQIGDISEDTMENINFQLCEIEEFIIGTQEYNNANLADADIRMMTYWRYIDRNCSFWDMIGVLKQYEGEI